MADLGRGVVAGFLATLVISLLMIMRQASGIMVEFQPIEILNLAAHEAFATPNSTVTGWLLHFFIGVVVWGSLFALLAPYLPGAGYVKRGLLFASGAWLFVMLVIMPLAGSGLFGVGFGLTVPIMTLIAHWIFGAVLGWSYGWLKGK